MHDVKRPQGFQQAFAVASTAVKANQDWANRTRENWAKGGGAKESDQPGRSQDKRA
jgi:hypothetical protein